VILLSCRKDPVITDEKPIYVDKRETLKFNFTREWTYSRIDSIENKV